MPACVLEGSVSAAREVWADVWSYACVLNFMAKGCICIKGSCSSFLQEHFEELLEFMSRYIPLQLCIVSLCMLCYTSLIPRPSPAPVFDRLQYVIKNWSRERPGNIDNRPIYIYLCRSIIYAGNEAGVILHVCMESIDT